MTKTDVKTKNIRVVSFWALALLALSTQAAQAATVNLAWDATGEAVSYVVRYGPQSGQHPNAVQCGSAPQCAVSVLDNQTYFFVVLAVGPTGLQSPPSTEVVARVGAGAVVLALSQTSFGFSAEGGTATLPVMASASWTSATTAPWLRIVPGSAASGDGMVSFAVTPNAGPIPRAGTLNVGGLNVSIVQPAGPPTSWSLPMDLSAADYDGDGKADITIYRDTSGQWFTRNSLGGSSVVSWGAPSLDDIPVPGDYDGDDRADVAVYRRSSGEWFIRNSLSGGMTSTAWGAPTLGDLPVQSDFDGDGRADIGVYRGATGQWLLNLSGGGSQAHAWGAPALKDAPVPADYDGDGRADIAVYRGATGEWFVQRSTGGMLHVSWGAPSLGDIPVAGDYDGDGRADIAVYRATTGQWFISHSGGGGQNASWGAPSVGDIPVPRDYDGDGRTDIAVYRSSSGQWFVAKSAGGTETVAWGAPTLNDIVRGR
jgi:hypothetical protein